MSEPVKDRCRLALCVSPEAANVDTLSTCLAGGDVACVLFYAADAPDAKFQRFVEAGVPVVQAAGVAAIVCDDTRLAGRSDADGIHLEKSIGDLSDIIARFSPHKSVGCGGMMDRHRALQLGELNPDYLLFGKVGGDIKPEPHPKNLALGEWWAEFVEIPGMVMAGSSIESVVDVAARRVDFVLAGKAVFAPDVDSRDAVSRINALLDEFAPDLAEEQE
ncbi:MAG: thiamine phosphate synthase [Pseudomonadota bacterium]